MLCEASKQPMAHICRSAWPYMFEPVFRWSSARCFLFIIAVCSAIRAAPSTYEGCPDVPPGWSPDCPLAAHARVRRGNNIFYWTPYTSTRWGNALSPYWQARAVAELAGYGFNAYGGFSHGWLKHLPKDVPPQGCPNITIFNQACSSKYCNGDSWVYAHRCSGAWRFIRPTIIKDTQAAVIEWALATNNSLPNFSDGDTVIQSRCNKDTLLEHPEFGPVGFSYYTNIRPTTKNIYIVRDPHVKLHACRAIHAAQVTWLKARYPDNTVQIVGGSLVQDFMQLLFAPVLFKEAQSSFGMWAGMANKGDVWSAPLLARFTEHPKPDLGPNWHWVDAPVLYPDVAQAANISTHDISAIINWLQTH